MRWKGILPVSYTHLDVYKRQPTPNNLKQAEMPEGAVVFDNDNGTAPGLAVEGLSLIHI